MPKAKSAPQAQLAELKVLNQRMEHALTVSRAGTFLWDARLRTFEWNASCAQLHGFPPDVGPIGYAEFFARVPEEERAALEQGVITSRDNRQPYESTYRVVWEDGTSHWIGARGIWEYGEDGTPLRLFGLGFDVDEQKSLELDLVASEQRLRDAHVASQLGAWELDLQAEKMTVSAEFCRIHGISQRKFQLGDDVLGIPNSDLHTVLEGYRAAGKIGGEYDVEHRAVHGVSGDDIWIHGRGRGQFDEAGTLIRVVGTNQDVTSRKHTEIAFLETARIFRALTQASPGLIFRANEKGHITFVNQEQWMELSGLAAKAWQSGGWWDAFHPSDRERAQLVWRQAIEHAGVIQEEFRWRDPTGQIRWLLLHAQPVFDDDWVSSFVGTGTDVTALKKSERERATLQIALAESQKMEAVGTLASGVAHDFNNFLAAVRGYVELARLKISPQAGDNDEHMPHEGADQAAAVKYLQQAEAAIDQAKDVTNGLLTFSRGQSIEHEPLCLNRIIADNVDLLHQLVAASVNIQCHLPNRELWVEGDSTQLRQILINLAVNGRDALGDEGGKIDVLLSFEEDQAVIVVQDGGHGMSDVEQERAIEPFFTTKQQGQGTGLGLSVVHGIVLTHHGELDIKSKQGVGTEVEIRLPLIDPPHDEVKVQDELKPVTANHRILFVEDNPLVREACALRMEANGYVVQTADTGEEGLAKFAEKPNRTDLVLLDVDLPGMNGVKTARRLRDLTPALKVIFVTGNVKNSVLSSAIAEDPVLSKPIDYRKLFETINTLVEEAGSEPFGSEPFGSEPLDSDPEGSDPKGSDPNLVAG